MTNYPEHQKTLIIREINANTYETFFDYWFDTQRLKHSCDELHTVWSGPPPPRKPPTPSAAPLESLPD
jgi:hypothetical protein